MPINPGRSGDPDIFHTFAYGSNMAIDRLRRRTPSARLVGVGVVRGHSLRWHKRGMDGSGKCDACFTANPADQVWGAVFAIAAAERPVLDRAEHLGVGYRLRQVKVQLGDGSMQAWLYEAILVDPRLRPFHWYKSYVLRGAVELRLPRAYRARIEAVPSRADPDPAREALHR
jgi:hypothetical protein